MCSCGFESILQATIEACWVGRENTASARRKSVTNLCQAATKCREAKIRPESAGGGRIRTMLNEIEKNWLCPVECGQLWLNSFVRQGWSNSIQNWLKSVQLRPNSCIFGQHQPTLGREGPHIIVSAQICRMRPKLGRHRPRFVIKEANLRQHRPQASNPPRDPNRNP